jgi:hypothetical protein
MSLIEWRGVAAVASEALGGRAFMFVQTEVSRPAKLRRKFESNGGVPQ